MRGKYEGFASIAARRLTRSHKDLATAATDPKFHPLARGRWPVWVDLWFAKIQFADSGPDFHYHIVQESRPMPTSRCSCFVLRDSSSAVMRPWRWRMLLFAFNSRPSSDNGDDPFCLASTDCSGSWQRGARLLRRNRRRRG